MSIIKRQKKYIDIWSYGILTLFGKMNACRCFISEQISRMIGKIWNWKHWSSFENKLVHSGHVDIVLNSTIQTETGIFKQHIVKPVPLLSSSSSTIPFLSAYRDNKWIILLTVGFRDRLFINFPRSRVHYGTRSLDPIVPSNRI